MNSPYLSLLSALWIILGLQLLVSWSKAWYLGHFASKNVPPKYPLASTPFVSIIIPAWKERSVLANTLTALQRLDYPQWEAIVVAGGADGTEDYAREFCKSSERFVVIPQPPRGKNAALNLGYARARGKVIVLLDADCEVEPEWLTNLVAPLTCGFDASLANYFATDRTAVSSLFELAKITAYQIRHSTVLHGGAIALKRDIIEKLGGFPEDVTVGVDWDLDERVTRLGAKKAFVDNARHYTHLPATLTRYYRDETRWRRAHLQSTWRFFDGTARGLVAAFMSLSFYITGVFFFVIPVVSIAFTPLSPWFICLWPSFWAWTLLRRESEIFEVLAFTRNRYWLSHFWVPPALLTISLWSGIIAMLTLRQRVIFFQGPRPQSR